MSDLITILNGDCRAELKSLSDCSLDSCLTDPPYELGFMNKRWDKSGVAYDVKVWAEVLRVLKPGAHLLAFGGTRTAHRLAVAIEDAGFEIRDSIHWTYASGFPKSLDVSKAIDKMAGAEREVIGSNPHWRAAMTKADGTVLENRGPGEPNLTAAATDEAKQWAGYGTALKPAHEIVYLARKPLSEPNVAANVLRWGCGALNIDASRIGTNHWTKKDGAHSGSENGHLQQIAKREAGVTRESNQGRWPSNFILSHSPQCEQIGEKRVKPANGSGIASRHRSGGNTFGGNKIKPQMDDLSYLDSEGYETVQAYSCVEGCPVAELDRQSGNVQSGGGAKGKFGGVFSGSYDDSGEHKQVINREDKLYFDTGGASRFYFIAEWSDEDFIPLFQYTAKASRAEREQGLDGIEIVLVEYETWEGEVRKARLRVDTVMSPPKVTAVSMTPDQDATAWSMFLFGSNTTAPSLQATKSTTVTKTSSIIESRTLSFLARSLTNANTAAVSGEAQNGGNPAESAANSTPCLTITNGKTESRPGVDLAVNPTRLRINGNAGSPADHPTVKPVSLMAYLVRLITPPQGTVLDCFAGSGTTGRAAIEQGFKAVLIEQDPIWLEVINARCATQIGLGL